MTLGPTRFRSKGKECTFAIFEADELELIGVTQDLQEQCGAESYLPWGRGEPSSFSAVVAVETQLHCQLASFGVNPKSCYLLVGGLVAHFFWFALRYFDGACAVSGAPDAVQFFERKFRASNDLLAESTDVIDPARYLCRQQGGEFHARRELPCGELELDAAAWQIIDLKEVAIQFCARVKRPLLHIELLGKFPKPTPE